MATIKLKIKNKKISKVKKKKNSQDEKERSTGKTPY